MKKIFLTLTSMLVFGFLQAQVIWQEDFETTTGTALPAGMTQTTSATDGGWLTGTGASLSSQYFTIPAHGRFVATNDDGCNCDKSNDILETPSFSLSGYTSNVYLQFDMVFAGGTYQSLTEEAQIFYSINGGTTWDTLTQVAGTNSTSWVTRAYLLTPLFNQPNVKLRFRYHDGTGWLFGMALDNIKVLVPPAKEMAVTGAFPGGRYIANNNRFTARVQSFGLGTVNTVTLAYQVGALAPVSKSFTLNPNINITESQLLTFDPASLPAGEYNSLKVWVTDINGTGIDANQTNDTAYYNGKLYVASQTVQRNVLIEEFTSSTCAPCASLNATFDPLLESNNPNTGGNFNVVKYQMNWPSPGNDPSYNSDGNQRRGFYGVSGIPFVVMNGTSSMPSKTQGAIDTAKTIPAFSAMTATLTRNGTTYNGSVNLTPYVTVASGSELYLYQAYCQKYYNYPGASTSQKEYHHAMRKMMPNGNGKFISSITSGTAINENSNYTFNTVPTPAQNSYDLWVTNAGVVEYVAFLQDTTTGEILNSASANVSVGIVELADNQQIGVYPIPANDFAYVGIKVNNTMAVSINIYDMNGKVVYTKAASTINAGQNDIAINTSSFASGTYSVIVTTPIGELREKMIVRH